MQNNIPTIIQTSKKLFALGGYDGFTIRSLATKSGVGISSIYHFFKDKDVLLRHIFDTTNTELGLKRAELKNSKTASEMLYDRIVFQFKHIEDVVFVLKYYLHYRKSFLRLDRGFVPAKAYLHIEEVLQAGVKSGEFAIKPENIAQESKVITHAINGFLLEYYPNNLSGKELKDVAGVIHEFLLRSLTNKEVVPMHQ